MADPVADPAPKCPFTPPYPIPLRNKPTLLERFRIGWFQSWIQMLYERTYTMKLGSTQLPTVKAFMVNEMSLVAKVLDDPEGEFPKHELMNVLLEPMIGNSIFVSNGEEWANQRAMINPAFVHTNLKRAFPLMAAATGDIIARMKDKAREAAGQPFDVDPLMTHVTADVIFRTIFSVVLTEKQAHDVYTLFGRYQTVAQRNTMLTFYGFPRLGYRWRAYRLGRKVRGVFAPIVEARVAEHKAGKDDGKKDILAALIEARHPVTGKPFTAKELVDQLALVFLAGHETTATALGWALYLLSECPDLQDKLHAEIMEITGGAPTGYEHVKAMEGVRNLFREALRLYPPVGFLPRTPSEKVVWREKEIKPGDLAIVAPWLVHRNPENWSCPHSFDPDRFATPEGAEALKNAWIPFGRGPRICIGAGFAQQEAALILAEIIRNFRISHPEGRRPQPIAKLTLRPDQGFPLIFAPR